jgi:hypothetical protein
MAKTGRESRLADWLWFAAFLVASSAACLSAAWTTGATFDEPLYINRSLDGWRIGSHAGLVRMGTMPLALDLDALPIYVWERVRGLPFHLPDDIDTLLPWFRVGTLTFWVILLVHARLIGRALAGKWGGRLAVGLVAFEPSLLAHAGVGGTDIALTACVVAFVYHFRMGRDGGTVRRLAWPTFWYAAAILAKASGLVFGPLCMACVELERLARTGALRRPGAPFGRWCRESWDVLRPLRRDATVIVGVGLVLVFIYCGCDWKPLPSFQTWARSLPDGLIARAAVWIADHLCIFSNAGEGLVRQISHNMRGHGVYLLGRRSPNYIWYYFPLALTMKLTLPLLLGPLFVGAVDRRALANWALVTAAGLLLFSLNCHVQIGIRLVLPLCVMLAVGLAVALVNAVGSTRGRWGRQALLASAGVGLVWPVVATATVWPNWLCYTNEFWGGTSRGYLCLSDSNYDWGQGLPELARWQRSHAGLPMDVWYFGTDPLLEELPVRRLPLHDLPVKNGDDVVALTGGHYLAASTTLLYGSYARGDQGEAMRRAAAFLRGLRPVARTTTFFIYDVRPNVETASTGGAETP